MTSWHTLTAIINFFIQEWSTTCLTFEEDPEPFGRIRDQNIVTMCREMNVSVISRASHTLYNPQKWVNNFLSTPNWDFKTNCIWRARRIIEKNGGKAPLTYRQFQNIIASVDPPPAPEDDISFQTIGRGYTPVEEDADERYSVPTLDELGKI